MQIHVVDLLTKTGLQNVPSLARKMVIDGKVLINGIVCQYGWVEVFHFDLIQVDKKKVRLRITK